MIQDIAPRKFDNTYRPRPAKDDDFILFFMGGSILLDGSGEEPRLVTQKQLRIPDSQLYYLFSIDDVGFFLGDCLKADEVAKLHGLKTYPSAVFRTLKPDWHAFGGVTAAQLYRWVESRTYCGRCAGRMHPGENERSMVCPECGLTEYPKISPATITAIIDEENGRLLMARSKRSAYTRWGLIAGFVEIGETFRDTVHREAMEEVGLQVKNVSYFKSQPWGFSDTEMIGFFAELSGSDKIHLQEEELSEARWFSFDEIPHSISDISIGYELIEAVRSGRYKDYLNRI